MKNIKCQYNLITFDNSIAFLSFFMPDLYSIHMEISNVPILSQTGW